jgi:ATP-dependent 26S proteasome regulatory subunit
MEIFEIHTEDLPLADEGSATVFVDQVPKDLTGVHIAVVVEEAVYLANDRVEDGNRSNVCVRQEDLDRAIDAVWNKSDTDGPRE